MTIVNILLFISFFSKSLYQLLAAFHLYVLPSLPLRDNGDIPIVIFIVFIIWDYLPTILLILTIASRPVRSSSYLNVNNRYYYICVITMMLNCTFNMIQNYICLKI
jgi:hypothetical protein